MIDFVTDPLSQEFIRRALLEVGLISLAGGALGCWIVFYGVSYAAESLSHALFPGLVIAALAGIPLLAGGIPGIAIAAIAIALIGRVPGIGRDTAVAVVVTAFFGLGALLALSPESPPGIQSLLFGDILAPSDSDLILSAVLAAVVVISLVALHWRLLAVAFDRTTARSIGASPALADAAVLVLLAAAVLVAAQGLGTLLAVAALVGPAATARVFTSHRVRTMMLSATLIGAGAGVAGIYVSYYAGVAAGASIAGCIVAAYLAALATAWARTLLDRVFFPHDPRPEAAR
jgi:ABC-type Mn2+/Zn2+ transport system permease subunit